MKLFYQIGTGYETREEEGERGNVTCTLTFHFLILRYKGLGPRKLSEPSELQLLIKDIWYPRVCVVTKQLKYELTRIPMS